jgi:hypothetical protein
VERFVSPKILLSFMLHNSLRCRVLYAALGRSEKNQPQMHCQQ